MQLLSGHRGTGRRSGLDSSYDNHVETGPSFAGQPHSMVTGFGAGGCALLLWQEKTGGLADANVDAGRTRTECVQRLRRPREFSNTSRHKGHGINCHNNRNERLYSANHNLDDCPGISRLNSYFQAKGGADFLYDRLDLFVEFGDDGCHAIGKA